MVELYGVVSFGDLLYSYQSYYKENLYDENISFNSLFFCERIDNIEILHISNETFFIHRILKHKDFGNLFVDILTRQKSIRRKNIKLKDLLKYFNYEYYEETESKNKFKRYLKKNNISNEKIEEIICIISNMYRLGNEFISTSIEMLQDYGVDVTENNLDEIIKYLTEIFNNTRIWSNNSWTPIEIRKNFY